MTLNVSLRVPDGIVIASDSLSTINQPISQTHTVKAKCDSCGSPIEIKDVPVPSVSVPASSWPYTQKVYPFLGRFGLAIFGSNFVNNRSMYSHITSMTGRLAEREGEELQIDQVVDEITQYFRAQLLTEWQKTSINVDLQPDTWFPFGFHVVGHAKNADNEPVAETRIVHVGKSPKVEQHQGLGCSVSGDPSVVQKIWQGGPVPLYNAFSLQDAIDYAKFLIRTTSDYQRFSGKLPTVGGEIDIALVTSYRGFQWISQKPLYNMLEKERPSNDIRLR
jgi:hypothetical protein